MTLTKNDLQLNTAKWTDEQITKATSRIENGNLDEYKKMTYENFIQLCKLHLEKQKRLNQIIA